MFLGVFSLVSCSAGDPVRPETSASSEATEGAQSADSEAASTDASADEEAATTEDASVGSESDAEPSPAPTEVEPEPVLVVGEDDIVEIVDLEAGEQHIDAQGNLIIMYGIAKWPDAIDALPLAVRPDFVFSSDFDALRDSELDLVAIDIGMCAAGIGESDDGPSGFGTVEFFVHDSPTAPLSRDPVMDRAMVTNTPIAGSGFAFPAEAACARGWVPVLRADDGSPTTARYVLTNRTSSSAPIERHVYQWQVDPVTSNLIEASRDADTDDQSEAADAFDMGQTVTFNEGPLADTTVVVDGWAELLGEQTALDGTRPVAVSLSFCPSTPQLPEFGLAVDGWNLLAAEPDSDVLGALDAADPTQSCFDGWLRFAVPHGAVPTGFFTSDGANAETGYAFWNLDGAALPPPEE